MKNLVIILGTVLLFSCAQQKQNIVEQSVEYNAHDYKYIYIIDGKTYKSNVKYRVGDTLSFKLPNELFKVK